MPSVCPSSCQAANVLWFTGWLAHLAGYLSAKDRISRHSFWSPLAPCAVSRLHLTPSPSHGGSDAALIGPGTRGRSHGGLDCAVAADERITGRQQLTGQDRPWPLREVRGRKPVASHLRLSAREQVGSLTRNHFMPRLHFPESTPHPMPACNHGAATATSGVHQATSCRERRLISSLPALA